MELQKKIIADSVQEYLDNNKTFVFYRKKGAGEVVALLQNDSQLHTTTNFDITGFVMAPFSAIDEAIIFPCSETKKEFYKLPTLKRTKKAKDYPIDEIEKQNYEDLVKKSIAFIRSGKADKVVTSRNVERQYDKTEIGKLFEMLLCEYPEAMVYIWHHPKVGLWIGATPEKILYVHEGTFSTMALAGTQLADEESEWKTKEKEEQQFVTDFITDQLIPVAHHLEISRPYTDVIGHLAHLRTDISGVIDANTSLKDVIFRVHPTPAVCGTPRNSAKDYILKNESYDRAYYTGFLGELNVDETTDLYVNLRCMQLDDKAAKIYVGGGITIDSEPDMEWEETYQKSLILSRFLT